MEKYLAINEKEKNKDGQSWAMLNIMYFKTICSRNKFRADYLPWNLTAFRDPLTNPNPNIKTWNQNTGMSKTNALTKEASTYIYHFTGVQASRVITVYRDSRKWWLLLKPERLRNYSRCFPIKWLERSTKRSNQNTSIYTVFIHL